MTKGYVARSTVVIHAPAARVWEALVNPDLIREYTFGTNVTTDWREGSPIIWSGEWQGRKFEDRGIILKLETGRFMKYSHYTPLSGLPDTPENRHIITVELSENGTGVVVSLSQDNNHTEKEREHSEKNWEMMLTSLKRLLEK